MNGTDVHQLAAAYALDAVDERERAEFEAHYPTCPVCRPEVAGFRETLSHLAAASASTPPASLKDDVMAEISTTRQLSPLPQAMVDLNAFRQRRQTTLRIVTLAAAVILIAAGAFVVGRQSRSANGYAATAAAVLSRDDTRVVDLLGSGTGSFKVAWSPSSAQVVVIGNGLAAPGPGKAYELWQIDNAGPHAMGLLDSAGNGQVRRVLTVDGAPSEWAVTVEPKSGVDAPTGAVLFTNPA